MFFFFSARSAPSSSSSPPASFPCFLFLFLFLFIFIFFIFYFCMQNHDIGVSFQADGVRSWPYTTRRRRSVVVCRTGMIQELSIDC